MTINKSQYEFSLGTEEIIEFSGPRKKRYSSFSENELNLLYDETLFANDWTPVFYYTLV